MGWSEDKAGALAAALAYYALFSLAPLVLIAVAIAGLVFGERAASGELYSQLAGAMGDTGARAVQHVVANMHQRRSGGIVATEVTALPRGSDLLAPGPSDRGEAAAVDRGRAPELS